MTRAALAFIKNPRKWWRDRLYLERRQAWIDAQKRLEEFMEFGKTKWVLTDEQRHGYEIAQLEAVAALCAMPVAGHIVRRFTAPLLAILLLAAPCEARTWRFSFPDTSTCYADSACTVVSHDCATDGWVVVYYAQFPDSLIWFFAADAYLDTLAGHWGSVEWEPTNAGAWKLRSEVRTAEGRVSCHGDTTAWIAIDPRPAPEVKFWRPGMP